MKLLLDTHTYLWAVVQPERLSHEAERLISDPANELWLSIASLWEATIKIASRKLNVPGESIDFFLQDFDRFRIGLLPITPDHLRYLGTMPRLHGDPFDRILIAQSVVDGLGLISADVVLRQYDANLLW